MSYQLIDKHGNAHPIDQIALAGRSTVTRPSDVVVSFVSPSDLPNDEYDVQPSLPHESLKIIRKVRITNKKNNGNGVFSYVTTATL